MRVQLGFHPDITDIPDTDRVFIQTERGEFNITEDNDGIRIRVRNSLVIIPRTNNSITMMDTIWKDAQ